MRILNLTHHTATSDQVRAGVFEPRDKPLVCELLTFAEVPSRREIARRTERLADVAVEHETRFAMIGGATYLMGPLEEALRGRGVAPLHAFAKREVVERTEPDGSVTRTAVFRHAGFVGLPEVE